jgi:predicted Zn-dependent protease
MLTQEEARKLAQKIISYAKTGNGKRRVSSSSRRSGQVEVFIQNTSESLTRFANNVITQNVHEDEIIGITLRVIHEGRTARVAANQTDEQSLHDLVNKAFALARHQKKDPKILGLTQPQKYSAIDKYSANTARLSPEDRMQTIRQAVNECARQKVMGSGTFANSSGVLVLANSKGLFAFHRWTNAEFALTAIAGEATGWASASGYDIGQLDLKAVTRTAIDKAIKGQNLVEIPPGHYTVILEPAATAELLHHIAGKAGALQYQEGRSFLSGQLGKKIMSEQITITDDVYHPLSQGMPFDFEGMPRQKVVIIEQGIARNIVYDRDTARKDKTQSTGHGLPQPNAWGPMATNLVMQPGGVSLNEMIKSTDHGILVTQFHYTNILEPLKLILTGLTRNGTFLIENGKITRGIKNMRFTESVLKAFSNIEMISRDLKYEHGFFAGGFVAPALKIRDFNFSSETGF